MKHVLKKQTNIIENKLHFYVNMKLRRAHVKIKQFEYEEEGTKRIRLEEIQNQISALEEIPVGFNMELSPGEKVYRNDLVRFLRNKGILFTIHFQLKMTTFKIIFFLSHGRFIGFEFDHEGFEESKGFIESSFSGSAWEVLGHQILNSKENNHRFFC